MLRAVGPFLPARCWRIMAGHLLPEPYSAQLLLPFFSSTFTTHNLNHQPSFTKTTSITDSHSNTLLRRTCQSSTSFWNHLCDGELSLSHSLFLLLTLTDISVNLTQLCHPQLSKQSSNEYYNAFTVRLPSKTQEIPYKWSSTLPGSLVKLRHSQ